MSKTKMDKQLNAATLKAARELDRQNLLIDSKAQTALTEEELYHVREILANEMAVLMEETDGRVILDEQLQIATEVLRGIAKANRKDWKACGADYDDFEAWAKNIAGDAIQRIEKIGAEK